MPNQKINIFLRGFNGFLCSFVFLEQEKIANCHVVGNKNTCHFSSIAKFWGVGVFKFPAFFSYIHLLVQLITLKETEEEVGRGALLTNFLWCPMALSHSYSFSFISAISFSLYTIRAAVLLGLHLV